ncbi:MAG: DNA polymerase III subunit delta [Bacteroidales bacterium]
MPSLKYEQILQQIKEKKFKPVYLLWGEEDYYIDLLTDAFENQVLNDAEKEFDFSVFYGQDLKNKEPGLPGVMADCKRYPMTSPYQLILIKEAQMIDKWDPLENYLKNPVQSTILVLAHKHKKIDKRKTVFKTLDKQGVLFESARLKDYEYQPWVSNYLGQHRYQIAPSALALLTESLGSDLSLISNELKKLMLNLPPQSEINENHIEQYIGINKDYNIFSLEKAISEHQLLKIVKIANYFKNNMKEFPLALILPQLYKHFCRVLLFHALNGKMNRNELAAKIGINPYFLNQYESCARYYNYTQATHVISILKEYDLKSKGLGSTAPPETLLEELIFRITHVKDNLAFVCFFIQNK